MIKHKSDTKASIIFQNTLAGIKHYQVNEEEARAIQKMNINFKDH